MRAVDKDRTLRFASAAEMSRALSSFTPSDEIPTGGPEALGLASTMATPQPREVTPTRPADTPPLGGTGAHSPALVSPAATTEPMTDIPARSAVAAKPARRHGWLMPSMALVALLAGVGGTYAFMSASSDAATVAVAAAPGSVTAPGYATATTTTGSAVAVGNGAATVTPIQPLEPVQVPAAPVTNDPVAENDLENTPPEPPARPAPARPATRRAPDVRIRAQLTSMAGHREWRSAGNLLSHYEWSRCWPRGMAFPERNWGVNIKADTTPDGALSNFAVAGDGVSNYPEICRCLLSHLPGASVGPSQTGSGGEITIGFGFENRSRID
jgi:hypothetical protein